MDINTLSWKLPAAGVATLFAANAAFAVQVSEIHSSATGNEDDWFETDMRGAGTAAIVDLSGAGGSLENDQPLPNSAVRLTTGADNNDKAEIGTAVDLGLASEVLKSVDIGFSFFKEAVVGGNAFAAPSLKLAISSATGTGDNYGQLVYEPNWNTGVDASRPVTTGSWIDVVIDELTGSGNDAGGGWFWTGGFEIPSSFAGPPIRSLSEWADAFDVADEDDFATARVVGIAVGVGSYNQLQVGYFDNVSVDTGSVSKSYDFELKSEAVPDSGSVLALLSASLLGLLGFRRIISKR